MRGCQEQTREGDLGGSPEFGWTGRPKTDNILLVGVGCYTTLVRKLNLNTIKQYKLYRLQWLNEYGEVRVSEKALVFFIGRYSDEKFLVIAKKPNQNQ
jgi:hypothetical protein